jgi:hypothetical protein
MSKNKMIAFGAALFSGILALFLVACSSGSTIQEGQYVGDMPVNTATVEAMPGGGYKTISGDPYIAVNGDLEQESMLPYGAGDQGIRTMEDETPFYSTN